MDNPEIIIIGSGIGGLVAGALLARYGKSVVIFESHAIPGGAAHSFSRQGFHFDSGPSFYCGFNDPHSANPLCQVLQVLGESVPAISYDPLGHYHFPEGTFLAHGNSRDYHQSLRTLAENTETITRNITEEFQRFEAPLLQLYGVMRQIPVIELGAHWRFLAQLLWRRPQSLAQLLPFLPLLQGSAGRVMDRTVQDPWLRRLIDLECFLLSGLKAAGTVAPEIAFMLGERTHSTIDYPLGGSGALVQTLVRGFKKYGGELRLKSPVARILLDGGRAKGVRLANGETWQAPVVISNATLWDTYNHLLRPQDLPPTYRQKSLSTPLIPSFMHLHLGIRAEGLGPLPGHHVVVHRSDLDITVPGNTCMISIPSVWDPNLAPSQHHCVHAYTLEPFETWQRGQDYSERKRERAKPLYRALERVIPDLGDRIVLELIGTPLTHAHFLNRYQGTYGPAMPADQGLLPGPHTPIPGLYRVGDSTLPGIGVPAVAASGIFCASLFVEPASRWSKA